MYTYISDMFCHAQLYTNEIFSPHPFSLTRNVFVFRLSLERTTNEVEHLWCLYSHGEFLDVLSSNFSIFRSFDLCNALQRVNSVVWLVCYRFYSRYRGFK